MLRKALGPIALAAGIFTALEGGAQGAIRVTLDDGTDTAVFYAPSSQMAVVNTAFGSFQLVLHTTVSNYPGVGSGGQLLQTLTVNDTTPANSGILPPLSVTAEIIPSVGALGAGHVTGADLAAVEAAALQFFTQPDSGALRIVSSVSSPSLVGAGTLQNNTTVNDVVVSTPATPLGSTGTEFGQAANTPQGYTLTSQLVISGANVGADLSISSSSSATSESSLVTAAFSEPSTLSIFGLGGLGLVLALGLCRIRGPRTI